jgi:hypothetical protein
MPKRNYTALGLVFQDEGAADDAHKRSLQTAACRCQMHADPMFQLLNFAATAAVSRASRN